MWVKTTCEDGHRSRTGGILFCKTLVEELAENATGFRTHWQIKNLVSFLSHLKTSVKGLYQISYCSKSYLNLRSVVLSLKAFLLALSTESGKHSTLGNLTMKSYCDLNSQQQQRGCHRVRAAGPEQGSGDGVSNQQTELTEPTKYRFITDMKR